MSIPDSQSLMQPFQPEYAGRRQFYLAVLDNQVRGEGENPSVGMILCKTKKRTIVECALRESNKPIGVSKYRMRQWCEDINEVQTDVEYDFVFVDQGGSERCRPDSFRQLVDCFREYKEKT
jgi:hypothetical protein